VKKCQREKSLADLNVQREQLDRKLLPSEFRWIPAFKANPLQLLARRVARFDGLTLYLLCTLSPVGKRGIAVGLEESRLVLFDCAFFSFFRSGAGEPSVSDFQQYRSILL
jgi:hypothetical protein